MAVPSPSIRPVQEPGGTHTYVYSGIVEQSGSAQDLNIDLTDIPLVIRQDPKFRGMLLVTFKSLNDNLSAVGPAVLQNADFHDDGAETNAYLTVQVTSDVDTRTCLVIVEPRHSIGR